MTDYVPPLPPDDLGTAGMNLWVSITETFELNPGELRWLYDACREADTITMLEMAWAEAGYPMIARGSKGQDVPSVYLTESRQHRATLASLIGRLKLPAVSEDDDALIVSVTHSDNGRKGASVRWGGRYGGVS